jgi:prepilin-type processing-associated H-X9-DG protein
MGFPGSSITAGNAQNDCTTPNDNNFRSDDVQGCTNGITLGLGTMGCCPTCPSDKAQARSCHPNGVNACFADGSVRFVGNDVPQRVWWMMNSRNDGQTYSY